MRKAVENYVCPECGFEFWLSPEGDLDFVPTCPSCQIEVIISNELHMIEDNQELLMRYWSTFFNIKIFGEYTCPKCETGHMTLRTSKSGQEFWGCTNFPDCKNAERINPRKNRRRAIQILNKLLKSSERGEFDDIESFDELPF